MRTVDADSLTRMRPPSVGVEQAGLEALLKALGLTGPQRAAAIGQIIARMAAPGQAALVSCWG